ncbi:hypothetical protein QOT17_008917 [Balamuthia mandrillaris]
MMKSAPHCAIRYPVSADDVAEACRLVGASFICFGYYYYYFYYFLFFILFFLLSNARQEHTLFVCGVASSQRPQTKVTLEMDASLRQRRTANWHTANSSTKVEDPSTLSSLGWLGDKEEQEQEEKDEKEKEGQRSSEQNGKMDRYRGGGPLSSPAESKRDLTHNNHLDDSSERQETKQEESIEEVQSKKSIEGDWWLATILWLPLILSQIGPAFYETPSEPPPIHTRLPEDEIGNLTLPLILMQNPFVTFLKSTSLFHGKAFHLLLLAAELILWQVTSQWTHRKIGQEGSGPFFGSTAASSWLRIFVFLVAFFSSLGTTAPTRTYIMLWFVFGLFRAITSARGRGTTFAFFLAKTIWVASFLGTKDINFILPHYFCIKLASSYFQRKNNGAGTASPVPSSSSEYSSGEESRSDESSSASSSLVPWHRNEGNNENVPLDANNGSPRVEGGNYIIGVTVALLAFPIYLLVCYYFDTTIQMLVRLVCFSSPFSVGSARRYYYGAEVLLMEGVTLLFDIVLMAALPQSY